MIFFNRWKIKRQTEIQQFVGQALSSHVRHYHQPDYSQTGMEKKNSEYCGAQRFFNAIIVIALFILFIGVFVGKGHGYDIKFNQRETRLMKMAYEEGNKFNMAEEMQAILLCESVAGRYGPVGDKHFKNWKLRAYGILQIRFCTAKSILKKHGFTYTDLQLLTALRDVPTFNLWVGRLYLQYLRKSVKTWEQAMLAWNVGLGRVYKHNLNYDPNNYLNKARAYMANDIRKFNNKHFPRVVKHTIVKGDTLAQLAIKYYGASKHWKKIESLNPGIDYMRLKIGDTIIIKE